MAADVLWLIESSLCVCVCVTTEGQGRQSLASISVVAGIPKNLVAGMLFGKDIGSIRSVAGIPPSISITVPESPVGGSFGCSLYFHFFFSQKIIVSTWKYYRRSSFLIGADRKKKMAVQQMADPAMTSISAASLQHLCRRRPVSADLDFVWTLEFGLGTFGLLESVRRGPFRRREELGRRFSLPANEGSA